MTWKFVYDINEMSICSEFELKKETLYPNLCLQSAEK